MIFIAVDFGANAFMYGIILATFSMASIPGSLLISKWSDKVGRKKAIVITQIISTIGWLIFLLVEFFPHEELYTFTHELTGTLALTVPIILLIVSRAITGFTSANFAVASTYVAETTTPENKVQIFGRINAANILGFAVGPIVGGGLMVIGFGLWPPIIASVVLSVVATIVSFKFKDIPKTKKPEEKTIKEKSDLKDKETKKPSLKDTLKVEYMLMALIMYFFVSLAGALADSGIPAHSQGDLGWAQQELTLLYVVSSIVLLFVSLYLLPKMKRFRYSELAIMGSAAYVIGFLLFSGMKGMTLFVAMIAFGFGRGLLRTTFPAGVSHMAPKEHQSSAQAFLGVQGGIAGTVGLFLGGALYHNIGAEIFWVASVIAGLGLIIGIVIRKNQNSPMTTEDKTEGLT
jgi:DHA1 family tetracycline resistance protein-like MFS transporter